MAVTYTTAVKTARMTAVRDAWGASAKLEILHSDGTTILATFTLSATVGDSTVTSGAITIKFTGNSASQSVTAAASGTATTARIRTSGNTDIITGLTCGAGSGEVNLSTTTIGSGATVTISSGTITHA